MEQQVGAGDFDRERLIEVGGAQRIERDERLIRAVPMIRKRTFRSLLGFRQDFWRERGRQMILIADRGQPIGKRVAAVADRLHDLTRVT